MDQYKRIISVVLIATLSGNLLTGCIGDSASGNSSGGVSPRPVSREKHLTAAIAAASTDNSVMVPESQQIAVRYSLVESGDITIFQRGNYPRIVYLSESAGLRVWNSPQPKLESGLTVAQAQQMLQNNWGQFKPIMASPAIGEIEDVYFNPQTRALSWLSFRDNKWQEYGVSLEDKELSPQLWQEKELRFTNNDGLRIVSYQNTLPGVVVIDVAYNTQQLLQNDDGEVKAVAFHEEYFTKNELDFSAESAPLHGLALLATSGNKQNPTAINYYGETSSDYQFTNQPTSSVADLIRQITNAQGVVGEKIVDSDLIFNSSAVINVAIATGITTFIASLFGGYRFYSANSKKLNTELATRIMKGTGENKEFGEYFAKYKKTKTSMVNSLDPAYDNVFSTYVVPSPTDVFNKIKYDAGTQKWVPNLDYLRSDAAKKKLANVMVKIIQICSNYSFNILDKIEIGTIMNIIQYEQDGDIKMDKKKLSDILTSLNNQKNKNKLAYKPLQELVDNVQLQFSGTGISKFNDDIKEELNSSATEFNGRLEREGPTISDKKKLLTNYLKAQYGDNFAAWLNALAGMNLDEMNLDVIMKEIDSDLKNWDKNNQKLLNEAIDSPVANTLIKKINVIKAKYFLGTSSGIEDLRKLDGIIKTEAYKFDLTLFRALGDTTKNKNKWIWKTLAIPVVGAVAVAATEIITIKVSGCGMYICDDASLKTSGNESGVRISNMVIQRFPYTINNKQYYLRVMQNFAMTCDDIRHQLNALPTSPLYALDADKKWYLISDVDDNLCPIPGMEVKNFIAE